MAAYYRHYKNKRGRKKDDKNKEVDAIAGIVILYFVILFGLLFSGEMVSFFILLGLGIGALLVSLGYKKLQIEKRQNKINDILMRIEEAGLENHINNFISRFGLGQESDRSYWTRRNYKISWNRIHDLRDYLHQKGIEFSDADIGILLSNYIDKREYDLTCNSISVTNNKFSSLSGGDFEKLLYRLYESMGYTVQINGKTGDQGGDLVINKDQERIVIQAKRYSNWQVGNSAVQEASAARNHYDCNGAAVVTTSNFTQGAIDLAKTNKVELINKELLQKMLLDNLKESWS